MNVPRHAAGLLLAVATAAVLAATLFAAPAAAPGAGLIAAHDAVLIVAAAPASPIVAAPASPAGAPPIIIGDNPAGGAIVEPPSRDHDQSRGRVDRRGGHADDRSQTRNARHRAVPRPSRAEPQADTGERLGPADGHSRGSPSPSRLLEVASIRRAGRLRRSAVDLPRSVGQGDGMAGEGACRSRLRRGRV